MATSFTTGDVGERDGKKGASELVRRRSWAIAAGLLAAGLGTIGAAYWDTLASTVRVWGESETFNHCFLILHFAIPVGTSLILPLQHITAQIVVPILRFTGIPVFLDGLFLSIPSGSFEVAEACSGVRYLISSVALGFLAANLLLETLWRRVALVALCVAIPIVANGLRAYGIVMIAHLSGYEYAIGADHLIYGWIFFSFVTLCLLGVAVALRSGEPADDPHVTPPNGRISAIGSSRAGAYLILVVAATASGWVFQKSATPDLTIPRTTMPLGFEVSSPWRESEGDQYEWRPLLPGATTEFHRSYTVDGGEVGFFAAYFWYQHQGAEVISESNRHFDGKKWRPASTLHREVAAGGASFSVNQVLLRSPQENRVVWYWYWIDGRFTSNRYAAKLLELKAKLLNGSGDAAYLALSTAFEGSPDDAVARLQRFLDHADDLGATLATATQDIESRVN